MAKRSMGVLLFALSVALLLVISARVSPGEARASSGDGDDPALEDQWTAEPAGAAEEPAPETPEPTVNIRQLLPGVSLSNWNLRLVNNTYVLTASFAPDVTAIRDGEYFDSRAAQALEDMLSGAEATGYTVCVRAAYRPYRTQASIFFGRATIISESQHIEYETAEQMARSIVAYPGTSEHQTGLCADIMDSRETVMSAEDVENLPVLLWLREHCAEYGFIYRYPKEKREITGWYEPWHFRYVGEEAAEYIMENELCLEEFYALF